MKPTWESDGVQLFLGDCLEILPTLAAGSVDSIITDLPYGTTQCKWDSVIPFAPMWVQVKRLLKPKGVFVTTASQPFTSALVMSNVGWFRQELIWDKVMTSTVGAAKIQHLRSHENLLVFYANGGATYNPQLGKASSPWGKRVRTDSVIVGSYDASRAVGVGYPKSILRFPRPNHLTPGWVVGEGHPTQKPVALYQYLIRTYTNPGETVLDICMGSGTTGVAAIMEGRRFVGGDTDPGYFEIAKKRISDAQMQTRLLEVI